MDEATPSNDPNPHDETFSVGPALDRGRIQKGLQAAFGPGAHAEGVGGFDAFRSIVERLGEETGVVSRICLDEIDDAPSPVHGGSAESLDLPPQIGRYRLAGEIARGGIGSIYKARDEDLGRDVALKVLLGNYRANVEMTRRFMEEAQIGGQLQHPGIVPVHEVGLFAGQQPYFAMKLVKGETLARLLENRTDPTADRLHFLNLFEQICQPLAYAHARGVIHRDLKPSNVMVGAFGEVQVMDWGVAKVLRRGGVADERCDVTDHTKLSIIETVRSGSTESESFAGSVLGTPAYMAPEQARGDVDDVDERSDVFGLGAILCEILTGKTPYVAATAREMLKQAKKGYLEDAMARIDACGADQEVIGLAKRCLAFEPRERPRDARAVATELREYLDSLEERARSTEIKAARVRMRMTVALTVVIALSLGAGAMTWLAQESREQEVKLAEESRKRTEQAKAVVATALAEARVRRASASAGDPADETSWSYALDAIQRAERLITNEVDAETRQVVADEKLAIEGGFKKSRLRSRLEDLRDIPVEIGDSRSLHALDSRYRNAFEEFLGRDVEAMELDDAVNIIRTHVMRDELVLALDDWNLVRVFIGLEQRGNAWWVVEEYHETMLSRLGQLSDLSPARELAGQFAMSRTEINVEDPLFIEFVKGQETATLVWLARIVSNRADFAPAEFCLREALRREPGNYRVHYSLGRIFRHQGKLDEALRHALTASSLRPERPLPWWSLGLVLERTGDDDGALEAYTRGVVLDPTEARFYRELRKLTDGHGSRFGDEALERTLSSLTRLLASGRPVSPEARTVLDALLYGSIGQDLGAEILVGEGAVWRFFARKGRPSTGPEWAAPEFDDSGWSEGASGFGYGDSDDTTVLGGMPGNYASVYIRRVLDLPDVKRFERISLHIRVDDGCVVYVNGKLLGRMGVSPEGVVASASEPLVERVLDIPGEELREGRNLIAIEGINTSLTSSDFSLIPVVRGELAPRAARERDRERLEEFRRRAPGTHADARLAYLEGTVLRRAGKPQEAMERFADALLADPGSTALALALRESRLEAENPAKLE